MFPCSNPWTVAAKPYALTLPSDGLQFLLFVISSILTLGVVVAFSMFIYISTFYTLSPAGVRIISSVFADFMAGSIVPLPFSRTDSGRLSYCPLRPCRNMPLRIYSGNISGMEALCKDRISINMACNIGYWRKTMDEKALKG